MVSLIGVALMLVIAFTFSSHKKSINWRTVGGAFAIQALVGALVLYFPPGIQFLLALTGYVENIISYSQDGITFIFGPLPCTMHLHPCDPYRDIEIFITTFSHKFGVTR